MARRALEYPLVFALVPVMPYTPPGAPYLLLDEIESPGGLRALAAAELPALASEVRRFLVNTVSQTGGHLAAGLGVVELTVALTLRIQHPGRSPRVGCRSPGLSAQDPHRAPRAHVDTAPEGRVVRFPQARQISPTTRSGAGHSSTSISAALGITVAPKRRVSSVSILR